MTRTLEFDAIGTKWQIDIKSQISSSKKKLLENRIKTRIGEFDTTYSRFRPDSLLRKMTSRVGVYQLPPDALPLFLMYSQIYELTGGKVTPLIGQVLVDAGYDEKYSLEPKQLHNPPAWDDVLTYNFPELIVKKPCLLDFGAAGKGYCIDIVAHILETNGTKSFFINAGGDICHRSERVHDLKVGLENPDNFKQVIGVAYVSNKSICASAGSRRKWANYNHVIDPNTLISPGTIRHPLSPQFVKATWVIADTTILADALATCLFFVSPDKLSKEYDFEYTILYDDFSIKKSPGFKGELFTK